jgi:ribosomal RNA-processing protein 7
MGKVKSAKTISGPKPSKASKSKSSSSSTPSSSSSSGPLKISSFTVLPLAYPSNSVLPSSSSSKSFTAHYLYIRAHAPTSVPAGLMEHEAEGKDQAEQEESRTLFVANLPTDATEESLRGLFGGVGPIEEVRFIGAGAHKGLMKGEDDEDEEDAPDEESSSEEESEVESEVEVDEDGFVTVGGGGGGGKGKKGNKSMMKLSKPTAVTAAAPKITPLFSSSLPLTSRPTCSSALITYLSALSLSRALSTLPSSKPRPYVPNPSTSGPISALSHYLTRHTHYRPPLSTIKSHADTSLAHHEHLKSVELARLTRAGQQEIVDEDGFTLVVRGGKYGRNLVGGGVGVASKSWDKVKEEETAKKKKSKELNDFYRYITSHLFFFFSLRLTYMDKLVGAG